MRFVLRFAAVISVLCIACHEPRYVAGPSSAQPAFSLMTGVTITDLGTLPGGTFSQATDVNALSEAAGFASTVGADFLSAHAVVWTPGASPIDIGTLASGNHSIALGINNLGQVVGYSRTSTGMRPIHAFVWTPPSGMRDLGVLGGDESVAEGINDAGQISGWSTTTSGETHAVLWDTFGTITDLGTLGGNFSRVNFLNELGQAPGTSRIHPNTFEPPQAIVWSPLSGLSLLGAINNGLTSEANRINDLGQVVGGSSTTSITLPYHPFMWSSSGGFVDLGTLGGEYGSSLGLNNLEQVVGGSTNITGMSFFDARPFLWTAEGGMVQLPSLGGDAGRAYDINDDGIAVGLARTVNGEDHAAMWTIALTTPTPVEQIDNVGGLVRNGVDVGAISFGQAAGLLAKLDAATRQVNRGNNDAAVRLLEAFIHQVAAYLDADSITAALARSLTDAAQRALSELQVSD